MHGLIGRVNTAISLYDFARFAGGGINLYTFFQLSVKNCPGLQNSYTEGCDDIWLEANYQGTRNMNRITLSQALANAEKKLADYIGYWPGPKYIENERHFMMNWDTVITTNYMKVPVTGQRKRTLLFTGNIDGSGSVPMTRTFIPVFNSYFGNVIRYRFGQAATPLNLPSDCYPLLYPQGIDEIDLSSGDLDTEKTINEGYLLRPFVVVERTDEFLTIDVPLVVAVKPELLWEFPDIKGNVRLLDACDEENFIDRISVYGETFEKPDGYVKIARRYCDTCNGAGCEGCNLPEIPVCLIPASSEMGVFQVRPIHNTGTEEAPCWEIGDVESCCESAWDGLRWPRTFDRRWAKNCFCTRPLELCIDYVSSCKGCYGVDCLDHEPCLLDPIVKMVWARLPILCGCTCFRESIAEFRDAWPLRGKGFSRGSVADNFGQYALGQKVGEVEAWLDLNLIDGKHRDLRIGMVG